MNRKLQKRLRSLRDELIIALYHGFPIKKMRIIEIHLLTTWNRRTIEKVLKKHKQTHPQLYDKPIYQERREFDSELLDNPVSHLISTESVVWDDSTEQPNSLDTRKYQREPDKDSLYPSE